MATFMQEFSIYHVLATVACIALFIWLRIRLFGGLDSAPADRQDTTAASTADASAQQPSTSS
jgi:hypothetical protein